MNLQHENWEDSGGAHDVFVVELEDDELVELESLSILESESPLFEKINKHRKSVLYPLTVDAILSVWYSY